MPNLRELKLSGSRLSSLRELGTSLKHLEVLWVSRCGLTDLEGLLRDRLVGEDPDPDLAATFDVPSHRTTRCLDLPCGQPAAVGGLEPELTEAHLVTALRKTSIAAFVLLTKFGAFWL